MNGSAPYWSATGSQVPDTRNRAPNVRMAGIDSRRRTAKRRTVRPSTRKAKKAEAFSNARSFGFLPVLSAISVQRLSPVGDLAERLVHLLRDRLGQRRVIQRGLHLLSVLH